MTVPPPAPETRAVSPRPPQLTLRPPSDRKPAAWGLGLSLLLHLVLVVLAFLMIPPVTVDTPFGTGDEEAEGGGGGETVYLIPIPPLEDDAGAADGLVYQPVAPRATGTNAPGAGPRGTGPGVGGGSRGGVGGGVGEAIGPRAGSGGRSTVDRIQIRGNTPEILAQPGPTAPIARTPFEEARARVHAAIQAVNDSIAAEGGPNTDWTVTDKNGRRWGIGPDGVYLGGVNVGTVQGSARDDEKARATTDRAIADGADRARIRDRFNERKKAIRDRKEEERKSGNGNT